MLSMYVQGEIKVLLLLSLVILISASRPVLSSNLQYHGEKMTNPASRQTCWGPSSLQSRRDFLRILCAERRKQGKREASAKRKWRARGEMTQIPRCDLLPERVRWSHLARSALPASSRKKNSVPELESRIINHFILAKFVQSRWLDIGLVLFLGVYGPRLRLCP